MYDIISEINELKQKRNAVILAHYYVPKEVQECADEIGDSFYLAKKAREIEKDVIVFCGVSFMGEAAKTLNPNKTVLLPDPAARCPMADMITPREVNAMRAQVPDLAVVSYVNSTAAVKALSDVCVTSSNAVRIVQKLPQEHIFFIPDQNLGHYVAQQVPEKHFLFNDGYCPQHHRLTRSDVDAARTAHPEAPILAHPECRPEVLDAADFVGSTSQIIDYATRSSAREFVIATVVGVFYELEKRNPDKTFYPLTDGQRCVDMDAVTLEKTRDALRDLSGEMVLDAALMDRARKPLEAMLRLAE